MIRASRGRDRVRVEIAGMASLTNLFDTTGFPPRWKCGTWSPGLGWTHIISDLAIFGAYMAIPLSIGYFVLRRRNVPFPLVFWLFVAFILSCGITHLLEAIIFYKPVYRLAGAAKAVTAVVSVATVIVLVRVIPGALRLPDIKAANERMVAEMERRQKVQEELERTRRELESRSGELTVQSHRIRHAMESASVVACQWVAETGQILWEIGGRSWLRILHPDSTHTSIGSWSEILPPEEFQRFVRETRSAVESGRELEFETVIAFDGSEPVRMRLGATPDRRVTGSPATLTGMARLI